MSSETEQLQTAVAAISAHGCPCPRVALVPRAQERGAFMAFRTERLLGREFRKIQPKLRMFAKAKDDVNFVRSDFASALRVKPAAAKRLEKQPRARETGKVAKSQLKSPGMKETSGND